MAEMTNGTLGTHNGYDVSQVEEQRHLLEKIAAGKELAINCDIVKEDGREGITKEQTECYNDTTIPWTGRPKKKFTVAVEGNIGSGKSTFLQYFKDSPSVEVLMEVEDFNFLEWRMNRLFCEPVKKWKNVRGYNTLDLMYKDSERWSLTFQSYVQLTMLQVHTTKQTKPVKLMERSIWSAKYCFVENLHRSGRMPPVDFAVLSEWFDWIVNNGCVAVDLIVYLQATPETCMERIKKRNRQEEIAVPMNYLETLHGLHEDWLIRQKKFKLPAPVLVLDANKPLGELQISFEQNREQILCGNC